MARKKKMNKKTFIKNLIKYMLIFGIVGILLIGGIVYFAATVDNEKNYSALNLHLSSIVYYEAEDGSYKEFEQIVGEENRIWADIENMPDYLPAAFVAIEDERFYSHGGFDIPRTFKATINYLFKKDSSYGGSTINQQLIKNITGDSKRTPGRKIIEICRAIDLDRKLEKDEILELYANTVYFSQGCYGVQTASRKYFGKDVSELTLAEAASIAGITQAPTTYDPILNPENNKQKQELVLSKMLELGFIDEDTYNEAVNEKLNIQNNDTETTYSESYFTDQVITDLVPILQNKLSVSKSIALNMIYEGGLKIYSTVKPEIQKSIDKVYKNPSEYIAYNSTAPIQSAMVVMDPYTGGIVGMSGGLGPKGQRVLNRATQTFRQPGSSIKPVAVYAPGFNEKVYSPATMFLDQPVTVPNGTNGYHTFKNSYAGYKGPVNVRYAVQQSINTVAVQCLQKLTVDKSYEYMTKNFKFSSLKESDKGLSPLALGGLTEGVSVMEMTAAYSSFTNNGVYTKPHTITKILDSEDNVIYEYVPETSTALSKEAAATTVSVLKSVVAGGTGSAAALPNGIPSGGKTGTTDDNKDRWFMHISPYYTTGVWVGYDNPKVISGYWQNPAITLFNAAMKPVYSNLEYKDFKLGKTMAEIYSNISENKTVTVCQDSGLLATNGCISVTNVAIDFANPLKEYCNLHEGSAYTDPGTDTPSDQPTDVPPDEQNGAGGAEVEELPDESGGAAGGEVM